MMHIKCDEVNGMLSCRGAWLIMHSHASTCTERRLLARGIQIPCACVPHRHDANMQQCFWQASEAPVVSWTHPQQPLPWRSCDLARCAVPHPLHFPEWNFNNWLKSRKHEGLRYQSERCLPDIARQCHYISPLRLHSKTKRIVRLGRGFMSILTAGSKNLRKIGCRAII